MQKKNMCICAFIFGIFLYFSNTSENVELGGGGDGLIEWVHINIHGIHYLNKNLKEGIHKKL
jgi:hypothetical protein